MKNAMAGPSQSYATLEPLTALATDDIGGTFERMAETLTGAYSFDAKSPVRAAFTVLSRQGRRQWTLDFRRAECTCTEKPADNPDFEVIVRESAWWDIATGRLSPMDVFGQGKMRILGDVEFGESLYGKLARDDGAVAVCGVSHGR